jgi:KDO2-lipid IV(A) lauroyltransferase
MKGTSPDVDSCETQLDRPGSRRLQHRWGRRSSFWLNFMFFCARRAGWFMRGGRRGFMALSTVCFRRPLRAGPVANAKWLLGPNTTRAQRQRFARRVLNSFYLFIYDIGRAGEQSPEQIRGRIAEVEGHMHYQAARAGQRGAILATAHLGSFEVGMAAARQLEPTLHVVFQHDRFEAFDRIRHALHERLGVREAPIDQGLDVWFDLRDALKRDEVVMMQGDRVMPGQTGARVPFCGGHIELPLGPVKLAAITGAPIVPVFAPRLASGGVRIVLETPIEAAPDEARPSRDAPPQALMRLGEAIERHVRTYPEQWLMLSPMWCEDQNEASPK